MDGASATILDASTGESVESLHALADDLVEAAKDYKDFTGQHGLLLRKRITDTARQIINTVKRPEETPYEHSTQMAEMAAIRMFIEMKVFDEIPEHGSISYRDLAARVGADESLIIRMAWMLIATGILAPVGEDKVAHTRLSKIYVDGNAQGVYFQMMFDEVMVSYVHWPAYFQKYGYQEPKLGNRNPHAFGWGHEEKNFWEIISMDPRRVKAFNQSMNTQDEVLPVTGIYDFSWIAAQAEAGPADRPLIVDIGGGKGQALKRIMAAYAGIPASRLVLQDRGDVIEEVETLNDAELRGVTKMPHDFFQEQPVKGALVYYIRRCLHDWSDDNGRIILSHLANAMDSDSRVLITELVMPNPPSALNAWLDLTVLNLGGKERTEEMFYDLTSSAGLELLKIWTAPGTEVAVIECKKALGN